MKILFFIESLRAGGKERQLVELIKGLNKYFDIHCELVLMSKEIHYKDIFDIGIKIHYIERKYIKKDPRPFFSFYKICNKYKPDIIHVWGNMAAIYSIPAKFSLNVPMINFQIQDAPVKAKSGLLSHKLTFLFSDLIVSNSRAGLKSYKAPSYKSKVIYNGFDFNRIRNLQSPDYVRQKFGIKSKKIIGMVASFSEKKDYKTYIEAANQVLKNRDDVTFLCIGSGDDSQYRKLVEFDFKDKIIFLGEQKDVESIMNVCDIGILTTNQKVHGEGIANAIMEFMALNTPVIATNGGGTKELVIDGGTGFLVKPNSVEELTAKVEYLLENEKIAINMGYKGRERIRQEFSIEKMTLSFVYLYKSFLNKRV